MGDPAVGPSSPSRDRDRVRTFSGGVIVSKRNAVATVREGGDGGWMRHSLVGLERPDARCLLSSQTNGSRQIFPFLGEEGQNANT